MDDRRVGPATGSGIAGGTARLGRSDRTDRATDDPPSSRTTSDVLASGQTTAERLAGPAVEDGAVARIEDGPSTYDRVRTADRVAPSGLGAVPVTEAFTHGLSFPDIGKALDALVVPSAADVRAAELFEGVDTDNPTLVANEGGFDINASTGPEGSSYIDLGNGAEVFVVTDASTGKQSVYHVEDGVLGERIPDGEGRVSLGNGLSVSVGESPAGVSEVNFHKRSGAFIELGPKPVLTLNSDNSMLTVTARESGLPGLLGRTTVNGFDVQSGERLVTDGVADVDAMSPQQQFDHYVDTPQGRRILEVEGSFYGSAVEQRLLVARVRYDRDEGGAELFDEFTPRRATLSGDDLADYDAAVKQVIEEIREQGSYTGGVEGTDAVEDLDAPVSESMLYILASSAVEAYGESPDALAAIQDDIGTWKISTDNADGIEINTDSGTSFSAGWYHGGSGTVQFNIDSLVFDYTRPDDNFELVTHELAHSLDNVGQKTPGRLDGIPPGFSKDDIKTLIAERERMFELAYPGQDVDSSVNQDFNTVADNSGFRNYTFFNRKEFWAELSATFLGSDAGAETVRNASPELYGILREYYGRDDLPEA